MVFRKFISNRNVQIKVKMNKSVYLGLSMLEVSKTLLNESINTMQNYDTWIQITLSCKLGLKMFIKTL